MKYRALTNIRAQGENHKPGDEIELTEERAAPLLKSGAIEPIIKPFSRQPKKAAHHPNNQEQ
jgi:hypothetical protein